MAASSAPLHPFSPWQGDPARLLRLLVGRRHLLADILDGIAKTSTGTSANHMLLVGQRGIGKSHLLSLIDHLLSGRLATPPDLPGPVRGWRPLLFVEEQYAQLNSLANLLLAAVNKLHELEPLEERWWVTDEVRERIDDEVCDWCFEQLSSWHENTGARVAFLIDNLQRVLPVWSAHEHQRFRGFITGRDWVVVLGTAPMVFEQIMGQRAALHDFFEIVPLDELNADEMVELLSVLYREDGRAKEFEARRKEQEGLIPGMKKLTGGNPRLVLFLYEVARRTRVLEIESALQRLLEELREYFVGRIDSLPPQQRKVLDTLAQMPGPARPGEIAKEARLSVQKVNAQLQRLRKLHYVEQFKLKHGRETRYDITERLFRIWRQTATVAGRRRFRFLADFLRLFYSPDQIRALCAEHLSATANGQVHEREDVLRRAEELYYLQAATEGELRNEIFSARVRDLMQIGEMEWAAEEASHYLVESQELHDVEAQKTALLVRTNLFMLQGRISAAVEEIDRLLAQKAFGEALKAAERLVEKDPGSAGGWHSLGIAAWYEGQHERAAEAFSKAIELGDQTGAVFSNLALAELHCGRFEEALKASTKATELEPKDGESWERLCWASLACGDSEQALRAVQMAVDLAGPNPARLRMQSLALEQGEQLEEALACAEKVSQMDEATQSDWKRVGLLANRMGLHERAVAAFAAALRAGDETAELHLLAAAALRASHRFADALSSAERAVELEPNAAAWKELGRAAGELGDHQRALEAFRNATEGGQPTLELAMLQTVALTAMERTAEALELATQCVQRMPNEGRSWELLGRAEGYSGQYEKALESFVKATGLAGESAELLRLQSLTLTNLDRHEEAIAMSERAVALEPESPKTWTQLGKAAARTGDYQRAADALSRALELGPEDAAILAAMALSKFELGDVKEARRAAARAVTLSPDAPWTWKTLGQVAREDGDRGKVVQVFADLSSTFPHIDPKELHAQAGALAELGHFEEALAVAEKAVALDSDREQTWTLIGEIHASLEHHDAAYEAFVKASQLAPSSAVLRHNQAVALAKLGRFDDALVAAETAVELDPTLHGAWFQLGGAAGNLKDHQRALEAYSRAAELEPGHKRTWVNRGRALWSLGRLQEAVESLETAQQIDPDPSTELHIAAMLAETNQPREAISRLDKARRLGAPVQEVEHGRGDLLVFAGQYDEARQAYDAALAERPDWSMVRGDRAVAEACLGRMGPLMEALPAALAEAGAQAPAAMCEFLLALGERCLQRGEANLSTGLFRTALVLEGWRAAEEGRERIGVFLRAALDAVPAEMPRLISLLREHVHDEDALQLLDPYCQAVDLVQTRDLSILEQLFPEVRELVCEIAFKIDPALEGTLPVK